MLFSCSHKVICKVLNNVDEENNVFPSKYKCQRFIISNLIGLGKILVSVTWIITLLIIWQLFYSSEIYNDYILPSPRTVFYALYESIMSGELYKNIIASLNRIIYGYISSILISLCLGSLIVSNKFIRKILQPPLDFLRQIPPLALLPLLLIWLGIGEQQKISIIILGSLFPILLNFIAGIENVDKKLIEVAQVMKLKRMDVFYRIYLPSALPFILVGLKIGLGFSWRSLVGAELIASSSGIGYMMTDAELMGRTDIIYVSIFVIGAIGVTSEFLLKIIINKLIPWVIIKA